MSNASNVVAMPDKATSRGKVQLEIKVQYGTDRFYPRNHAAEQFLRIQGGKTIRPESFPAIKALGYQVEFFFDAPSV